VECETNVHECGLNVLSPSVNKTIYVEATRKIQRDAIERLGFHFAD